MSEVRLDLDLVALARELARQPEAMAVLADELVRSGLVAGADVDGSEWLSMQEAGRRLELSADAVRMLANRDRLRWRRLGRRRYVLASDVKSLGEGGPGATIRQQTKKASARRSPPEARPQER